jgi:hypothetical protein
MGWPVPPVIRRSSPLPDQRITSKSPQRPPPSSAECKLSSWCSPSAFARVFVEEKSLAVSEYGRVSMSKWATGTAWKKVRSKWIPSRRSVFRISLQHWRASLDSWVSSICSRSPSTVKAKISTWFDSTMCVRVPSAQLGASPPDQGRAVQPLNPLRFRLYRLRFGPPTPGRGFTHIPVQAIRPIDSITYAYLLGRILYHGISSHVFAQDHSVRPLQSRIATIPANPQITKRT